MAHYCVHSLFSFQLSGDCEQALDGLAADFAFFQVQAGLSQPPGLFRIRLDMAAPDYAGLPAAAAAVYTPRNVVYRDGARRILDFGGRALGILDEQSRTYTVSSLDADLAYEAGLLFLLSRIGQAADERCFTRLHALAMAYRGRSILVVLPMGGGKSTLGAELLNYPELQILSDDSPLIGHRGEAYPFPLRLGLPVGSERSLPAAHLRTYSRMEFGPKRLVDFSCFAERVAQPASPGLLLIGRRTLAAQPRLEPATYLEAMKALVSAMIVGLGLFQGLEFVLEKSAWEICAKFGVGLRRALNAHRLVRASHCYSLHLGRDHEANAAAVVELARQHLG